MGSKTLKPEDPEPRGGPRRWQEARKKFGAVTTTSRDIARQVGFDGIGVLGFEFRVLQAFKQKP